MSGIQHMLVGAVKKGGLGDGYWLANLTNSSPITAYFPKAVTTDSSENTIVVASANNAFTSGYSNAVIVKYNSLGVIQWQKAYGAANEFFDGIAVDTDSSGNIYVAVRNQVSGKAAAVVVKLNSSGTLQWSYQYYYTDRDMVVNSIVTNGSYVYMSGWWIDNSGNRGGFITGTTVSGSNYATRSFTYSGSQTYDIKGITLDSSGNVYVVGNTVTSGSSPEGVIFKTNATLGSTTIRRINTRSGSSWYLDDIAVDSSGNMYIAGSTSYSGGRAYVFKLDSSFSVLWSKEFYSPIYQFRSISLDSSANPIVIGDDGGNSYGYMIKLDGSNGSTTWQRRYLISSPSGNLTSGSIELSSDSSKFYFSYRSSVSGSPSFPSYGELPGDGSKTGTYTVGNYTYIYSTASNTSTDPPSWSVDFTSSTSSGSLIDTSITKSVTNSSYTSEVLQ